LGAALSNSVAGMIVDKAGYSAAFLFLAACAAAAFLLFWIAMPETRKIETGPTSGVSALEPRDQRRAPSPAG
jgi:sugar phosphate permease